VPGLTGVQQIAANSDHTCAVTGAGDVWCWGGNTNGQLGDGTTTPHATPMRVATIANATEILAGAAHTCARITDGTMRCWGSNTNGELGNGGVVQQLDPITVLAVNDAAQIGGEAATPARAERRNGGVLGMQLLRRARQRA